jgi:hypothetical protein
LADELLGKNKLQVPIEQIATVKMRVPGGSPVQGTKAVAPQIKPTFLGTR